MELMIIIVVSLLTMSSVYIGYKMGKGESIELPKKMKAIIRNDEQEAKLEKKIWNKGRE